MIRRYVASCAVEIALFGAFLLYGNTLVLSGEDVLRALPLCGLVLASFALADAAVYLQNRGMPWPLLFAWEKLLRLIAAVVTGTALFEAAFAFAGTWLGYALPWRHFVEFSVGYGAISGLFALGLLKLAREPWLKGAIMAGRGAMGFRRRTRGWAGYPPELRAMLASLYHGDGAYSHEEALDLLEGSLAHEQVGNCPDAMTRAEWVASYLEDCLDPEVCPDVWEAHADRIGSLVKDAERLLREAAELRGITQCSRFTGERGEAEAVLLAQSLASFDCVAAGFAGKGDFRARLAEVVDATCANVRFAASQPDAAELVSLESGVKFGEHCPGVRVWTEPLACVAHAAPWMDHEAEVAAAYRRYIGFLKEVVDEMGAPLGGLLMDANFTLERLEGGGDADHGGEWPPF